MAIRPYMKSFKKYFSLYLISMKKEAKIQPVGEKN
jgi:hypothetical protein